MFGHAHFVSFDNRTHFVVSAKLVHSGFDGFIVTLCFTQIFNAPAFPLEQVDSLCIFGNHPVGANYTIISVFTAKQVSNQVFTVTVSYIFSVDRILIEGEGITADAIFVGPASLKAPSVKGFK